MPHTLLSVSGMSPAVITETLFAIDQNKLPWPDCVSVITTQVGANQLNNLEDDLGALCRELGRPPYRSHELEVCVVPNQAGEPVSDARSVEDHEALGDFIMRKVRDITSDQSMSVHASIAGGRKTMTFYLGYAMSLFGRSGDRLSHVLVSEPFEQVRTFRYPTRASCLLQDTRGQTVDARDAEVTLADIPFICLREELSPAMLEMGERVSFREMVELINLGDRESVNAQLRLELPRTASELRLKKADGTLLKTIKMNTLDYAFYRTLVDLSLQPNMAALRPGTNEVDTDLAVSLAESLMAMGGLAYEDLPLTDMLDILSDHDRELKIASRTIEALRSGGVVRTFFDTRCNSTQKAITRQLPPKLSRWFLLRQVTDDQGARLDFYNDNWPNSQAGRGYGIPLASPHIQLVND